MLSKHAKQDTTGTYPAVRPANAPAPGPVKCGRPALPPEVKRRREIVAEVLDRFMKERGISNVEAANAWGINESIVRDMRVGRVALSVDRCAALRGGAELAARAVEAIRSTEAA